MRKMKLLVLAVSLTLGFTGTFVFSSRLSSPQPEAVAALAWWGGLYPEYCLPGVMELKGEKDCSRVQENEELYGQETEIPVKIRFKYLTFLNDVGGNHE